VSVALFLAHLSPPPLDYHWLWRYRNLAELHTIITSNQIERREYDEVKKAQKEHRIEAPPELRAALEKRVPVAGETLGSVFIPPASLKGSRADLQNQYANYMHMCSVMGDPQL